MLSYSRTLLPNLSLYIVNMSLFPHVNYILTARQLTICFIFDLSPFGHGCTSGGDGGGGALVYPYTT